MKKIFIAFAKFIQLLFIPAFIKRLKVYLYTCWVAPQFRLFGKKAYVYPGLTLQGGKYISIGEKTGIGARGIITAWDSYKGEKHSPIMIIGNNVWIGEDCHITAINKIYIGNNVLMGKKITITDNTHGAVDWDSLSIPPVERPLFSKGPVIIEDDVWIGDKATILGGVTIGKGSIIGANAVVTKSFSSKSVIGGNPAKEIRILSKSDTKQ